MPTLDTLKRWLEEARDARHRLLTGSQREKIARGGTEITYTRATISDLNHYISNLESDIAQREGRPARRRALHVRF